MNYAQTGRQIVGADELRRIILAGREGMYAAAEKEIDEIRRILGLSREDVAEFLEFLKHDEARGRLTVLQHAQRGLDTSAMLWSSLIAFLGERYASSVDLGWRLGLDAANEFAKALGERFVSQPRDMVTILRQTVIPFADNHTMTIENRLRGELVRGIMNNDSVSTIAQRLIGAGLDTEGTPWRTATARAEATVRNEASRAYHAALREKFDREPWIEGYQFETFPEGPWPCSRCAPLHGRVWKKDDPELMMPPLHVNCRCQLLPVTVQYGAYKL